MTTTPLDRAATGVRLDDAPDHDERSPVFRALGIDELRIELQPILSLRDLSVVGLEALARFRGVRRDPPNLWFARADAMGLGEELEMQAVHLALRRLPGIPEPLFLSVNVSPRTAVSPALVSAIVGHGERLVVEITEHAPVLGYDELRVGMRRMRALGARVALDDVGAGFASLAHVVRIVPDIVKLDIALVRRLEHDQAERSLVAAVQFLAESIGAKVVAEGVETREGLDVLTELGVEYAQGFFLCRPMPLEDLSVLEQGGRG